MLRSKALCALLALAIVTTPACTQNTRIITEPEGAEVKIDGLYLGQGPVTFISRSGFPDQAYVEITLDGYEPIKNGVIKKSYRADLSLLLLLPGIIPYFFSARFEDDYRFVLKPLPGTTPPRAGAATGQAPSSPEAGQTQAGDQATTPPAGDPATTTPPPAAGSGQ